MSGTTRDTLRGLGTKGDAAPVDAPLEVARRHSVPRLVAEQFTVPPGWFGRKPTPPEPDPPPVPLSVESPPTEDDLGAPSRAPSPAPSKSWTVALVIGVGLLLAGILAWQLADGGPDADSARVEQSPRVVPASPERTAAATAPATAPPLPAKPTAQPTETAAPSSPTTTPAAAQPKPKAIAPPKSSAPPSDTPPAAKPVELGPVF